LNKGYKIEEIDIIVKAIKECVMKDCFYVYNRPKNIAFRESFNLDKSKIKELLMTLETKDFCFSDKSDNVKHNDVDLYVFGMRRNLLDFTAIEKNIEIYTKIDIVGLGDKKSIATISLHEADFDMIYLFE